MVSEEEEEPSERTENACAPLCVRGSDRAVGDDAFREKIHTAGVHKVADRPYT